MSEFKFFRGKKKLEFHSIFNGIIQRIYGRTLANDLVSVQPLNSPTGMIFYLDFVYPENEKHRTYFKFFHGLNYDVL
jgi:hypothetical protein